MEDLFSQADPHESGAGPAEAEAYFHPGSHAPLAVRMRPRSLAEVVGQDHVLGPGTPLQRLIDGRGDSSVILFGPPGTGKTTIASLISAASGRHFVALSALNSGVKEVRAVIENARRRLLHGERTVLFIDEVHRFSKTQQDALLAAVENRTVLLVAATTENPSFSVVSPLLSRSLLVQLKSLDEEGIKSVLRRAIADERGLAGQVQIADDALDQLAAVSGGDARRSLTYLEAVAEDVLQQNEAGDEAPTITVADVTRSTNKAVARYDRDGDQHYDVVSAFIKSIRGSDPDAALHYLARMIVAGEDPRFICRRVVISAAEDVGMADPNALTVAVSAHQAVERIGMPEGRIPLAEAVVYLATAPKSPASYKALDAAIADVKAGRAGQVPLHLRDAHYPGAKGLGHGEGYLYSHDWPYGVSPQEYLPETLTGTTYYRPTANGAEARMAERLASLERLRRGEQA